MSRIVLGAVVMVLAATAASAADSTNALSPALAGGAPTLDLRLRTEHVDNDSATQTRNSTATTVRARLGYRTGTLNDLEAFVEYEGVTAFDKFTYNSTLNGQTARPPVADPTGSELNQALLRYAGVPATSVQVGRQRLLLDNQRWVGNVGWRQNEQTFDGVVLNNKGLPGTELTYARLHNVNSIVFTNFALEADLANISYSAGPRLKATAYGYWLDFAVANTGNRQDSRTAGLRLAGAATLNEAQTAKLLYAAEFARQDEHADAAATVDDDYVLAELGGAYGVAQFKLGYEVLGSSDGLYAVQTPLATLHAHDGWADMFLATPATGLRDAFANLGVTFPDIALTAVYHQFSADFGGVDYGDEVDFSATYAVSKQFLALVKYASYAAASSPGTSFAGNVDTEKGWVQLEYKF